MRPREPLSQTESTQSYPPLEGGSKNLKRKRKIFRGGVNPSNGRMTPPRNLLACSQISTLPQGEGCARRTLPVQCGKIMHQAFSKLSSTFALISPSASRL